MSNSSMILLDTDNHIFTGYTCTDLIQQLLEHLRVQDDEGLAALAATCLNCDPLDVMIVHTNE